MARRLAPGEVTEPGLQAHLRTGRSSDRPYLCAATPGAALQLHRGGIAGAPSGRRRRTGSTGRRGRRDRPAGTVLPLSPTLTPPRHRPTPLDGFVATGPHPLGRGLDSARPERVRNEVHRQGSIRLVAGRCPFPSVTGRPQRLWGPRPIGHRHRSAPSSDSAHRSAGQPATSERAVPGSALTTCLTWFVSLAACAARPSAAPA